MAGRKSTLSKSIERTEVIQLEMQDSNAINPNIDYDSITDQIAKLEEGAADNSFTTPPSSFDEYMDESLKNASKANYTSKTLYPIDNPESSKPKKASQTITPFPAKQKPLVLKGSDETKAVQKDYPPINEDFLAFLIEKNPLSFGWVINSSFFTNFDIDPSLFKTDEQFIFWMVPASVNVFRTATAGGFQRSESRLSQIHPHLFLIKILDLDESDAASDPFIEIINDPAYLKLRENLEKRGIHFIYDHSPNRIWSSVLAERLKKK